MKQRIYAVNPKAVRTIVLAMVAVAYVMLVPSAHALTPMQNPAPQPGSYGLEATKKQAPPTTGATITTPGNGASFASSPITVTGICPTGLLVQVYDNGVMVGALMCTGGSFSIQVSLFPGANELTAIVYDDLDQPGPTSAAVTVNYADTHFVAFSQQVTLTSSYGRRSAPAGSTLTWPLQLSGGTGPYAMSIDWGDGSKPVLKSQALAGLVSIDHAYAKAGIYQVNITVTDANGVVAFLQLVAIASGKIDTTTPATNSGTTAPAKTAAVPVMYWAVYAGLFVLLLPVYWLGRRSMLISIRNRMAKERDEYQREMR